MRRVIVPAALLLLAAAPSLAAPAGARVADFERAPRLGAPAAGAARAAGVGWTTPRQRTDRTFSLLGARWRGPGARMALRVRRPGGRWSRWIALPPSEAPPAVRSGATRASEPVWTGRADGYQLGASRPLRELRVHFVAVGRPARAPVAAHAAAGPRPAIVPRSAWDPHGDCPPRVLPGYGRIDFAIVHHTVSLNGYGAASVPAMVLAICRFHRNANKWNDIGYDLLVDRFGRVFEGRGGGVAQPVVGAQAQGFNAVSTGIAAIGDFSLAGPPDALLRALARTIAWKLSLAGAPARGLVREVSIGGDLNRWPAGAPVRFARISGHRDADLTSCPGAGIVARLPALRALVARLLQAPRDLLTISPFAAAQPYGGPVAPTGRLALADGTRPAGAPVVLQRRVAGGWEDVAATRTGADGIWTAAAALTQNATLRALQPQRGIASPTVAVSVSAGVRVQLGARRARLGARVALRGATLPPKARVRVTLLRRVARHRFRRVRTRALATAAGRFATTLRPSARGVYRVVVATPADRLNAAGRSRPLPLRVR